MKTLQQLIDSLTLEDLLTYQLTTDRLMWIETDLLDPNGLSRRHALTVEDKLLDLLQDQMNSLGIFANQYDDYLTEARKELNK